MAQSMRTGIVVLAAFIAGWFVCGHIMAGREQLVGQLRPLTLRPGKGSADGVGPARWQSPGRYYVLPGRHDSVLLRHRFAGTGQALRWAEETFGATRVIAYCHDRCIVLIDRGLAYNSWDALLFAYTGPKRCELLYISYNCVTVIDSGDWPDCAYFEKDGRTLVFQTRAGKKLSVTRLPAKLPWP